MAEHYEHNVGDHEDPLPGPTWLVGFIGTVLVIVIVLGITGLFAGARRANEQAAIVEREPVQLETLRAQWARELAQRPQPVDVVMDGVVEERVVEIPIEDAMAAIVRQYGTDQP